MARVMHAPGATRPVCGKTPFTFASLAVRTDQKVTCPACLRVLRNRS